MKTKLILAIALLAAAAFGQTALTQTTLSSAITANQNVVQVASLTGIACSVTQLQPLYILDPGTRQGELVNCSKTSSTGGNFLTLQRGANFRTAHVTGAIVVISNANNFAQSFSLTDPYGANCGPCKLYTPLINTSNGNQWLWSTLTLSWVPGFNNPNQPAVTADVASAAGVVVPSGPLFALTGNSAITGFTLPVGFATGGFCAFPTGTFTWTTATNIGLAGTAVVGRTVCFTWDWATSKWYPSYV